MIVLLLKDINHDLCSINSSQIVIMTVRYHYKVLIFIIVAILLLIDNTNFAKADNYADKVYSYDSYHYPDYQYPDQSSTYSFFSYLYRSVLLPVPRSSCSGSHELLMFNRFQRSAKV